MLYLGLLLLTVAPLLFACTVLVTFCFNLFATELVLVPLVELKTASNSLPHACGDQSFGPVEGANEALDNASGYLAVS